MNEKDDAPITTPNPDPTVYTNEAIERAAQSLREWATGEFRVLEARLDANDAATLLRHDAMLLQIEDTPKLIQKDVEHLADLVGQRFKSMDEQFIAIESQRQEQKADAAVGLSAALSAQKEAAVEQNASNTLAINKSEGSLVEAINKNALLSQTDNKALRDMFDDLKSRMIAMEAARHGQLEQRTESRAQVSSTGTFVAIGAALLAAVGLFLGWQAGQPEAIVELPPVTVTVPAP